MKTLTTILTVAFLAAISLSASAAGTRNGNLQISHPTYDRGHVAKCVRANNGCSTSLNSNTHMRELRITNSPAKHRKHNYRGTVTLLR